MNSGISFSRPQLLASAIKTKHWDVIIIGGGATGLGTALDSASRGYKTLLLEQVDFAKGTSSRSTKLAHGGVRYLEQGELGLVIEALHERGLLLKNAPHLVEPIEFIIPNYKWWERWYYLIGLKFYDLLAGRKSFGKSYHLNKEETLKRLPNLTQHELSGSVVYKDGQFDDARLALNLAQTAIEQGATVLNYCKVNRLLKDENDNVNGVVAIDTETQTPYEFRANVVINATGVFADDILKMDHREDKEIIQPSQGVHLVFEKALFKGKDAMLIPKTSDGRVLFVIPWHQHILVGTTDTPLRTHSLEPHARKEEIDFILTNFNTYTTQKVDRSMIKSVFVGLRPLAAAHDNTKNTKEISRSHKILVSNSGLISITGGKWTTYRRMAEDVINKAIALKKLSKKPCLTENLSIHGSGMVIEKENPLFIYGSDLPELEAFKKENPKFNKKLHSNFEFTEAEVIWAIRYEMARTVEDILARRLRLLFLDAHAAMEVAPIVGDLLTQELQQDETWKTEQLQKFKEVAQGYLTSQ